MPVCDERHDTGVSGALGGLGGELGRSGEGVVSSAGARRLPPLE